jgi:hypothetical protein
MKTIFNFSTSKIMAGIGWYSGEEFILFQLKLLGIGYYSSDKHSLDIIEFQVAKFFIWFSIKL